MKSTGSREYIDATTVADAINRAITDERERCARVAEGFEQTRDWVPGSLYDSIRREVAARIRRGPPTVTDADAAHAIERCDLP